MIEKHALGFEGVVLPWQTPAFCAAISSGEDPDGRWTPVFPCPRWHDDWLFVVLGPKERDALDLESDNGVCDAGWFLYVSPETAVCVKATLHAYALRQIDQAAMLLKNAASSREDWRMFIDVLRAIKSPYVEEFQRSLFPEEGLKR